MRHGGYTPCKPIMSDLVEHFITLVNRRVDVQLPAQTADLDMVIDVIIKTVTFYKDVIPDVVKSTVIDRALSKYEF